MEKLLPLLLSLLLPAPASSSIEYVGSQKELRQLTDEEDFVLVLWTAKTCKVRAFPNESDTFENTPVHYAS